MSFFAEQARNRRVSWLLAVFAVTAVIVTGIPLGLVGAPLLFLAVMPLALVMTTIRPHSAWGILLVVPATLLPNIFGFGHQASTATYANAQAVLAAHGVWPVVIATVGLAVVPGAVAFLALLLIVRTVLRRSGVGALLLRLGARAPNPQDDEERRLVDVVQEIAVAAGIPAPHVAIMDATVAGGSANAAAVGWSIGDATVVVTRPLLDLLTRDQTQAMIARVIASIGNGDLRVAFLMLSIFQSVRAVQFALFGVSRWRTLRVLSQCARVATRRRSLGSDAERASDQAAATDLLAIGDYSVRLDAALRTPASPLGCLFAPALLPLRFSAWTIGFIIAASEYLLTGPLVDAAWRRRELLSDATAVRLTRNPDGLAGALERLGEIGVMVPQAEKVSYLFAAWWPAASGSDQAAKPMVLFPRRTHVTLERRVAQLVAMGAHPEPAARPDVTPVDRFVSSPAAGALDQSSLHVLMVGIVAVTFVNVIGWMMWVALLLTSVELFALGFAGLWIAQRIAHGPL
ncbi:MAG TPA: M48 family metalloprotease [Gemmatimonadaceae bacterium]